MAFYIESSPRNPGKISTRRASPLEIAAEEFLNGLLCHYEPPQAPYRIDEPANGDRDSLELRRPPSILKTSRSFEGKKHKNSNNKGKVRFSGVTPQRHGGRSARHGQRPRFLTKLACRTKGNYEV
jgi:hypothetical protein